jgi:hypothetical protein
VRHLRTTLAAEVVADPYAGPMCLHFLVQNMTEQIPTAALPLARWSGTPQYLVEEPDMPSDAIGYYVDVVWPEPEAHL